MNAARLLAASLVLMLSAFPARADDVTDQIDEALAAYKRKDVTTAIAALDAATALLRQSRVDVWKRLLPDAPPGWTAAEAEGTEVAAVVLGGGIGASRSYTKGESQVEVSLLTDSPAIQGLAAMISSPLLTGAAGRTLVVGGRRFAHVRDENALMTMIANKVLLRVKGNEKADEAALRGFVANTDFAAIEAAAR